METITMLKAEIYDLLVKREDINAEMQQVQQEINRKTEEIKKLQAGD
jgi:FtsZ-binding cell division protein ZapB